MLCLKQKGLKMKGLILINAYYATEDYLYPPKRLREEFEKLGVKADIKRNDFFPFIIDDNEIKSKLSGYDFCVYLDKDKYILKALSLCGIPLFNSMQSIFACDDKMNTYLELSGGGIKMPKTLPGLLCYSKAEKIKPETVDEIERQLSYPLTVKESFGSLGKGVYLVKDREELCSVMEEVKLRPHLYQEFISSSYGKDVRVIVIGDEVVGGMLRSSNGDFRSNVGAGGQGERFEPTEEMKNVAVKVAKVLGLEYCGIDFLFGEGKEPIVCEVNSNAFFLAFEKSTGINVALLYAEHILKKIKGE